MRIEYRIINTGTWFKIRIVSIEKGFSQTLKDGKMVNTTTEPQEFEEEILTFGKHFTNENEAIWFMSTKGFKAIFKSIEKTWPTM